LAVLRDRAGPFLKLAACCAALCAAPPARAGDNDLELWLLGHPDSITTCTLCNGTDNKVVPGDPMAQVRFARMTAALGLAFVPGFGEPAASAGQAGFEIGFTQTTRFLDLNPNEWATQGSQATASPPALAISTLAVRKGLGASLDIGAFISYLAESQMVAVGAEVRASLLDGIDYAPDLAVRAYGARVTGTQELDLTIAGADVMISKSFGVAGMIKLQPYGQYGMVFVNANTGIIDFNPTAQDPTNPSVEDGVFRDIHMLDNRYNRFALGLRLVAGIVVVGLEASDAFGTNPVQSDQPAGGVVPSPSTQTTHELGIDAHLGLQF